MGRLLARLAIFFVYFGFPILVATAAFASQDRWMGPIIGMVAGALFLDAMIESGLTPFERRSPQPMEEDRDW